MFGVLCVYACACVHVCRHVSDIRSGKLGVGRFGRYMPQQWPHPRPLSVPQSTLGTLHQSNTGHLPTENVCIQ